MKVQAGDSVYIDAWCTQCEAPYYRSVRPLVVGHDELKPELFVPLAQGTPPPSSERPICPTCNGNLRFVAAAKAADHSEVAQQVEQRPVKATVGGSTPPLGATETLFQVGPDEQVVDISRADGAFVVVTNRRIVRVNI